MENVASSNLVLFLHNIVLDLPIELLTPQGA